MNSYIFMIAVLIAVAAILLFATFGKFTLSHEQYDRLKWVALHWDILVVFIALVVKLFNVPYGQETVTLVAGIGAALGGLIGVSNKNFHSDDIQNEFNTDSFAEMMEGEWNETEDNTAEEQ